MTSKTAFNVNSDYGYLNILINNDSNEMKLAEYNETRLQPIVTNMNDWQIGITRLKIPTTAIPLMIFEDNQYEIGFCINTPPFSNLISETVTYDRPANDFTQFPYNRYIFYYDQFLFDVNNALQKLWNSALLDPAYAGLPASGYTQVDAPYFRLKSSTEGYLELVLPCDPTGTPSCPFNQNGIRILMSNRLFFFFSGFASNFTQSGWFAPVGKQPLTYVLQIDPTADSVQTLPAYQANPQRPVNVIQQDYPSLFLWQSLTRIFITTTVLLEKEVLLISGDQGQPKTIEVLTDFEIPQTQQGLREYIFYQPQGNLRYINFKSTGWLDRFDLKVFFQTKDLQTFQLVIPPTFEMNLKLEFKRRKAHNLLQYSDNKQTM